MEQKKLTKSKFEMYYGANQNIQQNAKNLRKRETNAEKLLWEKLRNKQLGVKFRRQHPIDIFIADFYCHEKKLVIELDGEIHNKPEIAEYDKNRTFEIEKNGIKVIRFTNQLVEFEIDNVIETIVSCIKN
jgi:cyclase